TLQPTSRYTYLEVVTYDRILVGLSEKDTLFFQHDAMFSFEIFMSHYFIQHIGQFIWRKLVRAKMHPFQKLASLFKIRNIFRILFHPFPPKVVTIGVRLSDPVPEFTFGNQVIEDI